MTKIKNLAHTRSGDKGSSVNVGVIAFSEEAYQTLKEKMTIEKVKQFFLEDLSLGTGSIVRYELDNLLALNFVISDVLQGGGSLSLNSDAQGKGFGQLILEMTI